MLYYIFNNQIVGDNADSDNCPNGFSVVEFEEHSISNLYYDGFQIKLKPSKPGDNVYWSSETNEWLELQNSAITENTENWLGLMNNLRSTGVFIKAYDASTKTLKANTAFSLMLSSLTSSHNLDDLKFSFSQLRAALKASSSLADFTSDELEFIKEALTNNGFDANQFELAA